jgi:ferric-dicitrate binding protein FerR (iron transport regulator)
MEDRFYLLIARKFSGALTEAEGEELDRLLLADPSQQLIMEWFEQMIMQEQQQLPSFEAKEAYVRHWLKYREEISDTLQEGSPKQTNDRFYRNKKRIGAIALAMVCLLGLGYWWMFRNQPETSQPMAKTSPAWQTQVTQIAEKRKVSLPDGSIVWLNAGSSLRYDAESLIHGERQVFLEGEAFFDIAHNKQRPFRVRSGTMEIKVLGTAFNVKAYPEDANFETSLIRGAVEVRLDDRPDDVYQLRPHEKLVVSKQVLVPIAVQNNPQTIRPIRTITPLVSLKRIALADSGRLVEETAWLQNKLMFRSESFVALAKMLERRYGYRFVFENEETETLEFTGTFTTETIVQALEAMQMVHGFQFRIDKENIYIR